MSRLINGYLITHTNTEESIKRVQFEDDLDTMYKLVHCDILECITRYIDHVPYNFIIDECGTFHSMHLKSAYSNDGNEFIVGSILIVSGYTDNQGNMLSLEELDYVRIAKAFNLKTFKLMYDFK